MRLLSNDEQLAELEKAEEAMTKICNQTDMTSTYHPLIVDVTIKIRGLLWQGKDEKE